MALRDGPIAELKQKLYGQAEKISKRQRSRLRRRRDRDIASDWDTQGDAAERGPAPEDIYRGPEAQDNMASNTSRARTRADTSRTIVWWAIGAAAVFFLIASSVAAYFFFTGSNALSTRNVDIAIAGPTSVEGGDVVTLDVTVTNNNARALQLADLLIEYPDGTRTPDDIQTELPRKRISLGTIDPGEQVTETVRAVVFGESGAQKNIDVSVEYRLRDSNAIFVSEGTYVLGITSAPLALSVDGLTEVVAGQDTEMTVTVTSNAETVTEDVIVSAQYPFGFSFDSASPEPANDDSVWRLGDIPAGGERTITLRGTVAGQEREERVFRFSAGIGSEQNPGELGVAYITGTHELTVNRPFLSLDFAINDERSQTVTAKAGQRVDVEVFWQNNADERIHDTVITLLLDGRAFNPGSVDVQNGFYNSNTNTVRWDADTNDTFEVMTPGERGSVEFSFEARDTDGAGTYLTEPRLTLSADVESRRLGADGRVTETFTSSFSREVTVSSGIGLTARTVHGVGPFDNTGPVPPTAGEETTYTILWTATNGANAIADGQVTAQLPSYVTYTGSTNPPGADISYNDTERTVTWNVGNLESGGRADAAFRVSIRPSVSQIGDAPILVSEQGIRGFDRFVEEDVQTQVSPQTTQLPTDSSFSDSVGDVVQ